MLIPVHQTDAASESSRALFSAHSLTCIRDDRVLFEGLSFNLRPGDLLQIDGANGSGKSSLLRILCGLLWPEEGEVRWSGKDIRDARQEYQADMAYLGHVCGVANELTGLENLAWFARLHSARPGSRPMDLLASVGLAGFEQTPVRRFSAGQRRRLGLARLLLSPARIWILDEPLTSLDVQGVELVRAMLMAHCGKGGLVILSTHQPILIECPRHLQLCLS